MNTHTYVRVSFEITHTDKKEVTGYGDTITISPSLSSLQTEEFEKYLIYMIQNLSRLIHHFNDTFLEKLK